MEKLDELGHWPKETWMQRRRAKLKLDDVELMGRLVGILKAVQYSVDHAPTMSNPTGCDESCQRCAIEEMISLIENS